MDGSNNGALLRLLIMQEIFEAEDVEKEMTDEKETTV
jgi:hypothetical protein